MVIKANGDEGRSNSVEAAMVGLDAARPTFARSVGVLVIFLALWFLPVIALSVLLGPSSVYVEEGVFFSKASVLTFGGAYSVLAYIAQQAVEKYAWLGPGEMLDGLGMAETTPGPLITVVQFVGFMGAYRNPGPFTPLMAGILGSLVTSWVTFVPCFMWIFLGAPYIERLRNNRHLSAALSSITAAVVGVILNLAVWFSAHALFASVDTAHIGPVKFLVADWANVNVASCVVAIFAGLLTFYWKAGILVTLAASTLLGAVLYFNQQLLT